ncbi:non-specific lipid transfer protein GPI-anchored 12-like isoform X1 [Vigna umbellata]|uniref:non-specific lipid transfer protein GPI-anchored 12-like isoform X1 n=1 Tax=Vigna umbellata TaxID=87088 RepID=UPI001F5E8D46|nr:non-specific lipid transfer protein GPI-anchored 12-like isoform X1 [Vigna umbellata]
MLHTNKMIPTTATTLTIALLLALASCATSAPSPAPETAAAPAPGVDSCFLALTNMSDCLTFVEAGSNLTMPEQGCCPGLAGLIDTNPICLCDLLGKPDAIGLKIDLNRALKLPSICKVSTPPVSACAAVGVPVSLPPSSSEGSLSPSMAPEAPSPSNNPASSPDQAGGPAPSSSDASTSPAGNINGVSAIKASALTNFIFGLSTVFASSFF